MCNLLLTCATNKQVKEANKTHKCPPSNLFPVRGLTLKDYCIDLALHIYNTVGLMIKSLKGKKSIKVDAAESEILPGTYNTHNATALLTVKCEFCLCYASSSKCNLQM